MFCFTSESTFFTSTSIFLSSLMNLSRSEKIGVVSRFFRYEVKCEDWFYTFWCGCPCDVWCDTIGVRCLGFGARVFPGETFFLRLFLPPVLR